MIAASTLENWREKWRKMVTPFVGRFFKIVMIGFLQTTAPMDTSKTQYTWGFWGLSLPQPTAYLRRNTPSPMFVW